MKNTVLFLILSFSLNAQAGGFRFPNVPFDYAKVYLFNIDLEKPGYMDFRIYKDSVYAKSKLGNGVLVSEAFHQKINKAFAKGIDEIVMGLSKCFMPRHGVIYYNAQHEPVASLSICFECEKVSVWSKEKIHFTDDFARFDYEKGEKQMEDLAKIMKGESIPVYIDVTDEYKYVEHVMNDETLKNQKSIQLEAKATLAQFPSTVDFPMIKGWIQSGLKLYGKETIDTVENTNGALNILHKIAYEWNTHFSLLDGKLGQATIFHPGFILPLGISVGMSIAEVYQKLGFKIPEEGYPKHVALIGEQLTIDLDFNCHTLRKIELNF